MARLGNVENLTNLIIGDIKDGTADDVREVQNEIQEAVDQGNRGTLKEMGKRTVNQPQAPGYVREAGASWEKLSPKYVRYKKHKGYSTNFYSKEKKLRSQLSAINARRLLGEPQVRVSDATVVNAGTRPETIRYRSGRKRTQARTAKGRFASIRDVEEIIPARLVVTTFPNIEIGSEAEIFEAKYQKVYYKLTNPKEKEKRPVMRPFLQWYNEHVHLPRIEKEIES